MIFLTLFCIILGYLLSIIINVVLLVYAYKISHKETTTIGQILSKYNRKKIFIDEIDEGSFFILWLTTPIINTFFIFYSFIYLGYCFIEKIKI